MVGLLVGEPGTGCRERASAVGIVVILGFLTGGHSPEVADIGDPAGVEVEVFLGGRWQDAAVLQFADAALAKVEVLSEPKLGCPICKLRRRTLLRQMIKSNFVFIHLSMSIGRPTIGGWRQSLGGFMADAKNTYVWKKGDNLDKVAKAHGLKDGNEIWKAPDNKSIVKTRGKPESLVAGDKLAIPPSQEDFKKAKEHLGHLESSITYAKKKIDLYGRLAKEHHEMTVKIVAVMNQQVSDVQKTANEVDLIYFVKNALKTTVKIAASSTKITEATGHELDHILEHNQKEAISLSYEPLIFMGMKIADAVKDSHAAKVVTFTADVLHSLDALTSPSHWMNVYVEKMVNGKPFSQAVLTEVGDTIKDEIARIEADDKERVKFYLDARARAKTALDGLEAKKKQATERLAKA